MQIQYVSKYIALSKEGLFPELNCPMDQGPLLPNQDHEEQVFVYCLSCEYKKVLGSKEYNDIVKAVENAG
jgi:hypothetical protein